MDTTPETFGEYIRRNRLAAKLSQEELGKSIGFGRSYISMIENGVNPSNGRPPRLDPDKFDEMARVLKVPVLELRAKSWVGGTPKTKEQYKLEMIERMKSRRPHWDTEIIEEMATVMADDLYSDLAAIV